MRTIRSAREKAGDMRLIIFFLIDDTGCRKVWSHYLVTTHIVAEGYSAAWDFRPYFRQEYCKEHSLSFKSKNELAVEMVKAFPANEEEQVYVLMDNWYTGKELVDACLAKGFHIIGAVKSNRLICPAGIQVSIFEFASRHIENSDLHSVTMKDKGRLRIYDYEGSISNIENARVLLSWEHSFSSEKKPFCLLSTDISLDVVTILEYYSIRWEIETAYRYFKEMMGFDHYQLLSFKVIERYWTIQYLTQNFLEIQRVEWSKESPVTFGEAVRKIRSDMFGQLVVYVYQEGWANTPLEKVLKTLPQFNTVFSRILAYSQDFITLYIDLTVK